MIEQFSMKCHGPAVRRWRHTSVLLLYTCWDTRWAC